jgi:hypothetical protein
VTLALLLLLADASAVDAIRDLEGALAEGDAAAAMTALAKVAEIYPKATEEERKVAVARTGEAVKFPDVAVRHAAFAALARMRAKGSSKHLAKWLAPPNDLKAESAASYVEAIRAAGAIADASTLETLEKLSDHRELDIAAAATEALGGFRSLPLGRRKALAFDLVDRLVQLASPSRRADWSEGAVVRRTRLAQATGVALRNLTGKTFESADAWKAWKAEAEKRRDPFE